MKITEIMNAPWMISPENLSEIIAVYQAHFRGPKIDIKGIEARLGSSIDSDESEVEVRDGIAIVPISGPLINKGNALTRFFGMASMQDIGETLKKMASDEGIHTIILDIDSPGGTVSGTTELADLVHEISKSKKVISLANDYMASGAVFIGTAANEVYVSSDMGQVGSIGVARIHVDYSKAYEGMGIKVTDIYAGKYKRITSENKPLSKEGEEHIQEKLDSMYSIFVERVAKYRGVSVEKIIKTEARVFTGKEAIEAGLVDGVSTMDELLKKLSDPDGDPGEGGDNSNIIEEGNQDMEMTLAVIKEKHPSIYAEILATGKEEALKEGAKAETTRIKGIEAHAMPGHEKLVETMKFDGETTPDQAAAKILTAEKGKLSTKSKDIEADASPVVPDVEPGAPAVEASSLSVEDQCKKKWESDPKVKDEFTSLETYTAFTKADSQGQVNLVSK